MKNTLFLFIFIAMLPIISPASDKMDIGDTTTETKPSDQPTQYYIKLNNSTLEKYDKNIVDKLATDSPVIEHQIGGLFSEKGTADHPIQLDLSPAEFKLYVQTVIGLNNPHLQLNHDINDITSLLQTTEYLLSTALLSTIAKEFLSIVQQNPELLDDWIEQGGSFYLEKENPFAQELDKMLEKGIQVTFKKYIAVNDRPGLENRKIIEATFLPKGSKLAVALTEGTIKIYDMQKALTQDKQIFTGLRTIIPLDLIEGKGQHTFSDTSFLFNPQDPNLLYFKGKDSLLKINLDNNGKTRMNMGNRIFAYKPRADGTVNIILINGVYNFDKNLTEKKPGEMQINMSEATLCKFIDDTHFVSSSVWGYLQLFSLRGRYTIPRSVNPSQKGMHSTILDMAISPNGQYLGAGVETEDWQNNMTVKKGYISIWDTTKITWDKQGTKKESMIIETYPLTLTFTPDNKHLFAVEDTGALGIWNMETKSLIQKSPLPSAVPAFPIKKAQTMNDTAPCTFAALFFSASEKYLIEVIDTYILIWEIGDSLQNRIRYFIQQKGTI